MHAYTLMQVNAHVQACKEENLLRPRGTETNCFRGSELDKSALHACRVINWAQSRQDHDSLPISSD